MRIRGGGRSIAKGVPSSTILSVPSATAIDRIARRWEGVSTSIRQDGEPVAVAS